MLSHKISQKKKKKDKGKLKKVLCIFSKENRLKLEIKNIRKL